MRGIIRTSKNLNLLLIAIFAAAFIYLAYSSITAKPAITQPLLSQSDIEKTRQQTVASLDAKYRNRTLSYEDESYGYKLRYPYGYNAEIQPSTGVYQQFTAFQPPFSVEIIQIRLFNASDFSPSDIEKSYREENVTFYKTQKNDRLVYVGSSTGESLVLENETVFFKQAFYECRDPQGKGYWLSFTAAVSEALSPDLELVDYMISTIEC